MIHKLMYVQFPTKTESISYYCLLRFFFSSFFYSTIFSDCFSVWGAVNSPPIPPEIIAPLRFRN